MAIKGIKKAVGDYRKLNAGGAFSPVYGVLMLNRETGEIWVDEFVDSLHGRRKMYSDAAIIDLHKWSNVNEQIKTGDKVCMATIRRLAENAVAQYKKELERQGRGALIEDAEFQSLWDDDITIKAKCKVNLETKEIFNIDPIDLSEYDVEEFNGERVIVDGIEYRVNPKEYRNRGFWREPDAAPDRPKEIFY